MHAIVLQDWITVSGILNSTVVTQPEEQWLDLMANQDVGIYVEVSNFSGTTPTVTLQTSPTKDDSYFRAMTGAAFALSAGGQGLQTPVFVKFDSAAQPLTRYVRWQCTAGGSTAWTLSFRVVLVVT
jgi:hypothetical protein